MKKILLLSAFFISLKSFTQDLKIDSTGKYSASAVVEVSATKDELFNRAKQWIALRYTSANNVIQLSDKENGEIICKGNFAVNLFMKQGWIKHTLILEFKDNKFRYTFTDLSYFSFGSGEFPFESKSMGFKKKITGAAENNIEESISGLTAALNNKSNDNW